MKSFTDLAKLRDAIKHREEARQREQGKARARAQQLQREAQVFAQAVEDAIPLKPSGKADTQPLRAPPVPRQRLIDEQAALAESLSDQIDIESLLDTDEALSYRRPGVGADVVARLRRGHWSIKGHLDMHGLRVEEAREALVLFLLRSMRSEMRCVRIVHGKGLGSVNREPVLKGKVLKWLVQREEVMAFCQARPNDGGSGALIVLLRSL